MNRKKGKSMKSIVISMVATAGLVIASSSLAVDMPAIGKAKCSACHAIDKRVVGPAFMDVSKKYQGDKDAVSKITASITKGGSFGWKFGKMPPRGLGANDAEIKSMAEFIAGLAK
jgi:cytochrome c